MDYATMAEDQRQGGRRQMFLQAVRYYRPWSDDESAEAEREGYTVGPSSFGSAPEQLVSG